MQRTITDIAPDAATAERYVYCIPAAEFEFARRRLLDRGYRLSASGLVPWRLARPDGTTIIHAAPRRWNGLRTPHGSWHLLQADHELPFAFAEYFTARVAPGDVVQVRALLQCGCAPSCLAA